MTGIPVVQLSNVQDVDVTFTAWDSPVWRARLWVDPYIKRLPFMADNETEYNRYAVSLENVIIDFTEYLRVPTYEVLRETPSAWCLSRDDPSILYIHFEEHNPPFKFLSFKSGLLMGFSYGKSVQLGELKTYPLLQSFPDIEDQADNFTYQKMRFSSGQISIDNSAGMLDDLIELFGNDINLLSYTKDEVLEIVRSFYIERYTIGLTAVDFTVKDKRSRLTFKAPNELYTREAYPFIDDNHIDKVKQDAYGYCRGVPGVCLNRNQVYNPPDYEPKDGFNDWFEFKFAREITSIDEVWIKKSDIWTQVFPGLGVPGNEEPPNAYLLVNPHPIKIVTKNSIGNDLYEDVTEANKNSLPENDGRIAIWWNQALRDNVGFLERRNGNAETVKMTGIFVDLHTPGDIVKDMLEYYGELPYAASYFNLEDWELEMAGGKPIGICLDRSDDIYSWIEKIQNGSMLGFQLLIYKNLFSARVDNPNRQESFDIHWSEILNRADIAPEMNGDAYATFTTINYLYEYTEKEWKTVVDQSLRENILDVYKYEKEYTNDCYLINEEDVIRKGKMILENFMEVRPFISGIELDGLREDEIKLFSTGWIDFSMDLPRQMKSIQRYMKRRSSMGRMRVKILKCRRDYKTEKTYIDVIACDRLEAI